MEVCCETSPLNDRRMLNNEILKKIFAFRLREQLKIFLSDHLEGFNISNNVKNIYFIGHVLT